eukprot:GFYU01022883.1.p1 GENE.GFYU01022883.1~~GFYU01022883.1.p1  ORF type:complete len:735 (+),score=113.09 GFYU01022883.1:110-2206(+)
MLCSGEKPGARWHRQHFWMLAVCLTAVQLTTHATTVVNSDPRTSLNECPIPQEWTAQGPASSTDAVQFIIALKQLNLDQLHDNLVQISDPTSSSYGQFLSTEEISDLIRQPETVPESLLEWLHSASSGHPNSKIDVQEHSDFVEVWATVDVAAAMFSTSFSRYTHRNAHTPKTAPRIRKSPNTPWSIPTALYDAVDFISGIADFPQVVPDSTNSNSASYWRVPFSTQSPLSNDGDSDAASEDNDTQMMDNDADTQFLISPYSVEIMYNQTHFPSVSSKSSVGVIRIQNESNYTPTDLTTFLSLNDVAPIQRVRTVGHFDPHVKNPGGESTLDIQYVSSLGRNATHWYWTSPHYLLSMTTEMFEAEDYPNIISYSGGYPEPYTCGRAEYCPCGDSHHYVQRMNTEFLKLAVKGVTVLIASGDSGGRGLLGNCCNDKGSVNDPFLPAFPAASPYVTAVGGTMLPPDTVKTTADPSAVATTAAKADNPSAPPPMCSRVHSTTKGDIPCALSGEEVAASQPEAAITSGGGFSTFTPRETAWYQTEAVDGYFASKPNLPDDMYFNRTNRGLPDISAFGDHMARFIHGRAAGGGEGTSFSSPVLAGLLAVVNDYQIERQRPTLGFVNPLLYRMAKEKPEALNDVVKGHNKCGRHKTCAACGCSAPTCCQYGYETAEGWDPATGLGTINVGRMLEYLDELWEKYH